jgi:hypothetical protein
MQRQGVYDCHAAVQSEHRWDRESKKKTGWKWKQNHKKKNNWKQEEALHLVSNGEYAFMVAAGFNKNTWVANTGASKHMGNVQLV